MAHRRHFLTLLAVTTLTGTIWGRLVWGTTLPRVST